MWKLFWIVLFSLTIVIICLLLILKITLIVLAASSVVLFTLYKIAPLKSDVAKMRTLKKKEEKSFQKDKLTA